MTDEQIAPILVALAVLLAGAHVLGYLAVKLRQPRFVGEILAGVVLGPFVLGELAPDLGRALLGDPSASADPTRLVLGFLSGLGLLLLMFVSGSEVRRVLAREQRRPTAWILGVGTAVPFVIAFVIAALLPLADLQGPSGSETALLVVIATAAAVTSIPVISRIFHDLRILHTRFASLVLGTAMLEDVGLHRGSEGWAVRDRARDGGPGDPLRALEALSSADLRQGRAVPPDPQAVPRQAVPS